MEFDDGQGDICRVCRSEGASDRPLFHPCICMGSIKFIHQDCLTQWMRYSRKEFCELCGHRFSFIPIYSPDMPRMLPVRDVLYGLLKSITRAIKGYVHFTIVVIAWVGVVPLYAYRMYRSLFSEPVENIFLLPLNLFSAQNIPMDIFKGLFVVSCTFFATIGLIWLREQILHGGGPEWLDREDNNNNNQQNVNLNENINAAEAEVGGGGGGEGDVEMAEAAERVLGGMAPADVVDPMPAEPNPINRLDNEINADPWNANEGGNLNANDDDPNARNEDGNWNPMEWDRDELTWERLLGLDGSMVFLEHVFWVISLNTVCILVFAYLPYKIGNFIISTLGLIHPNKKLWHFHGFLTAVVGYCAIGLILLKLHAIATVLNFRKMRRLLGISYIVVKVTVVLMAEIGLLPLMCGWFLDMCSMPLFNVTLTDRVESFRAAPGTSLFLHWVFGMIYVYYFATFLDLLREVLRPGVLWFLRNINDPDYSSLQEKIHLSIFRLTRRLVASTLIYGVTITLILWVPIRIIQNVTPNFLPYVLPKDSEVNELTFQFMLLHIMLPGFYEQTRARIWLRYLIKAWCNVFSFLLGLKSYLLGDENPEGEEADPLNGDNLGVGVGGGGGGRMGADDPVGGIRAHHAFARDTPMGYQPYTRPRMFVVRLVGLLLCIGLTLIVCSFINLTVPVALGRKGLQLIGRATDNGKTGGAVYIKEIVSGIVPPLAEVPIGPLNEAATAEDTTFYELIADFMWKLLSINLEKPHELYTAIVGACTCWELARLVAAGMNLFPQGRRVIVQRVRNMMAATVNYAMAAVMFLLMFGVVPLLFGLLLELVVVVPLRVPFNQTPVLFLIQDWTLGVLYTKITCAVLMMGPDTRLKLAIERAYQDGVRNINLRFIVTELAIPVIGFFGIMLSVPYVLAYSIAPLVVSDELTLRKIARRIYPAMFVFCLLCCFLHFVVKRFKKLYEAIKNDKYLVGQRLVNYDHRKRASQRASSTASTASAGSAGAAVGGGGAGDGGEAF